ncbi:CPBP family intramembrane glutamic endopeptidase [Ramlibacter algicola]|uniref:CPBP family intramembrane metalloprotease n=1 Tax=Ramlibacter algicola TaxID=2795217 RepID=A0A934UPW9_9BURK|nr:CPBP family intramembrane glutamic endopeptidase [Ramlibacter algicola]MBK0392004.1 CPBP family intramembrane metalloprotease [Ramlibacter algicola]
MAQPIGPIKAVLATTLCFLFASFGAGAAKQFGAPAEVATLLLPMLLLLIGVGMLFSAGLRAFPKSPPAPSAIAKCLILGFATAALNVSVILSAHSGSPVEESARPGLQYLLAAGVLGPLSEEILFVGFLFSSLRTKLKLPLATAVVAILFSIAHAPSNALSLEARLIYMVNSCLLFEYSMNLSLNVIAHMLGNGLTVLSYSEIPWLEAASRGHSSELMLLPVFFLGVLVALAWTTFAGVRVRDRSTRISESGPAPG